MSVPRGSVTLERALQALVVGSIVAAVFASGSLLDLLEPARVARWVLLVAFAACAAAYALGRHGARPGPPHALAAALVALGFLSTAWSSAPDLTFARTGSVALLLGGCAAITLGAAADVQSLRRIVHAVVAAGALVTVGGLLVLVLAYDRAVQGATAQEAARYQGLGGGPNTAAMLLAVVLPLAAYVAVDARTRARRALALTLAVLMLGSIVASGSRGALLAALAGLLASAVLAARSVRERALAVGAVAALAALSVLAGRLPQPDPAVAARPGTVLTDEPIPPAPGFLDANVVWRRQEDIGRPPWGQVPENTERSFLGASGRRQAWGGALRLAAERPALGYGFGMEGEVFADRYLEHGSNLPENSYIGLSLQLGAAGVALFAAVVWALFTAAARALRTAHRRLAAAAAGAFAAGLVLALTQSFIYSAGNNVMLALWLCAFLLPAAAAAPHARLG